jgi:hypothetical protein
MDLVRYWCPALQPFLKILPCELFLATNVNEES